MFKSVISVFLRWRQGISCTAMALVVLVAGAVFSPGVHAFDDDRDPPLVQIDNRVNINTADAETLALALDGVGISRAQEIIAYREQHGEFTEVDHLTRVRGIGPATLERNRDRIMLKDSAD